MSETKLLITGASRGLGAAAARSAAKLGARVVLVARSKSDLERVAADIRAAGGSAETVSADLSRPSGCLRAANRVLETLGGLDGLVNNAGMIQPIAPVASGDWQAWETNLATNLLGPAELTRLLIPALRKTGGRVINVSSGAAVTTVPGWAAYCSAKAALNHFTRVLAEEEPGITAISIRPGAVDTAMQEVIRRSGESGMPRDVHSRFVTRHQTGALLPPELPGRWIAVLALYAPHEWSGDFVSWNDENVQQLVRDAGAPGNA